MSRQRRPAAKKAKNQAKAPGRDFWGEGAELPPVADSVVPSDPTVILRSLGAAPLAGHEKVAGHYFAAVYEKAAGLAGALAASSSLLDHPEPGDD